MYVIYVCMQCMYIMYVCVHIKKSNFILGDVPWCVYQLHITIIPQALLYRCGIFGFTAICFGCPDHHLAGHGYTKRSKGKRP